jgi:hypothetical protein
LKLGEEAITPYLVQLLNITINNATNPSYWKKAIVVPIYIGGQSIAGLKLQTCQFNLSGLQENETRYRERTGYSRANIDSAQDIHVKVK